MPRYDYKCLKGHEFEVSRRFGEREHFIECPVCGEPGSPQITVPSVAHVQGGTGAQAGAR